MSQDQRLVVIRRCQSFLAAHALVEWLYATLSQTLPWCWSLVYTAMQLTWFFVAVLKYLKSTYDIFSSFQKLCSSFFTRFLIYNAIASPHLPWNDYRTRLAQLPRHGPAWLSWVVRKLRSNMTRISSPLFTEGARPSAAREAWYLWNTSLNTRRI